MMTSGNEFSFMTEPPSLDNVISNEEYKTIRKAALLVRERMQPPHNASGLLTASRTLVETTCKSLLDQLNIEYSAAADIIDLGKQLAIALDLFPSTKTNDTLKKICQAPLTMINGIAYIRNAHGDAHGKGQDEPELPFRHAELVAHLSFILTRYFIEAYENKISRKDRNNLSKQEISKLIDAWLEIATKYHITNPDNLPFSKELKEIARLFTQKTNIVLPPREIFLALMRLRKKKELPKPDFNK